MVLLGMADIDTISGNTRLERVATEQPDAPIKTIASSMPCDVSLLVSYVGARVTYAKERERLTIEKLAAECIDVRELRRAGLLNHRHVPRWPGLRWPGIERISIDRGLIQIELVNQTIPQNIQVSWTRCNFGGTRPWMHCPHPHCNRRVARLYEGLSGYYCRECVGNPPYESQLRNKKARAYLQAYRLRQQLGGSRPVRDPIPERPYRMWRKTYERIRAEIERLERTLIGSRVVKRPPLWIRPLSY
jgi:hypothetical protein